MATQFAQIPQVPSLPSLALPTQTLPQTLPQQNKTKAKYATFQDYSNIRLSCNAPAQKQIPGTGPQGNPPSPAQFYNSISFIYDTSDGATEKKAYGDLILEGCEMTSSYGIQTKPSPGGKGVDNSIMVVFDPNNADHDKFLSVMVQLHGGAAHLLDAVKGRVQMPHFNAGMPEATGLKSLVYQPRDQTSGALIPGRSPSMFLKLFQRGKGPLAEETLFTGLDGKAIPWALLKNVEMKFIPLMHFKSIYVGGGKASIQEVMMSAIVTSVRARNTESRQLGTISRLTSENPNLADEVAAQLAKLSMDRQEQLLAKDEGVASSGHSSTPENKPTFSGILSAVPPTYASQMPTTHSLPTLNMQQFMQGVAPVQLN